MHKLCKSNNTNRHCLIQIPAILLDLCPFTLNYDIDFRFKDNLSIINFVTKFQFVSKLQVKSLFPESAGAGTGHRFPRSVQDNYGQNNHDPIPSDRSLPAGKASTDPEQKCRYRLSNR